MKWLRGVVECTMGKEREFHLSDELWIQIVYDFAAAYHVQALDRGHLLRSMTPLYLARVASFITETREMFAAEVEDRIEKLCSSFEKCKPYLLRRWRPGEGRPVREESVFDHMESQFQDKLEVQS
jgi:hypothetical protein